MNSDEKFEELYSKILTEKIQSLENLRESAKIEKRRNERFAIIIITIGIIIYIMSYFIFSLDDKIVGLLMVIYGIVICFVDSKIKPKEKKSNVLEYNNEFKKKVINTLLKYFEENIEYYPNHGISLNSYNEAEFEKYDRYRAEDYIKGTLKNNCKFEMSEVLTEYKNVKDIYETLFCGIFAKIETTKPFNAKLYLRNNRQSIFGEITF